MARRIYRGVPPSRMTLSPTSSGKGIALRARGAAGMARTSAPVATSGVPNIASTVCGFASAPGERIRRTARALTMADRARLLRSRVAAGNDVDGRAFAERSEGDRHHFRFIVSPDDTGQLGSLRNFTRELMDQAARDLGTRLDWPVQLPQRQEMQQD